MISSQMVPIDTAIDTLKNTYDLDTYLEFMGGSSGVKDVIQNIYYGIY